MVHGLTAIALPGNWPENAKFHTNHRPTGSKPDSYQDALSTQCMLMFLNTVQ